MRNNFNFAKNINIEINITKDDNTLYTEIITLEDYLEESIGKNCNNVADNIINDIINKIKNK